MTVLRDVSIEVRSRELVALLGVNGNGKSTLLNCILGFVRPTSGRIVYETAGRTVDLIALKPHEIANLGIVSVPEGRRLAPNLTVEENLRLAGGSPRGRKDAAANFDLCFDFFPVLEERRRQYASTLSGGEQQQLAIARALMMWPDLMVVDEPSVGLAPLIVDQLIAALRKLQETRGMTILMAEQSFFQAINVASRAYVLSQGAILREFDGSGAIGEEEVRHAMMGVI